MINTIIIKTEEYESLEVNIKVEIFNLNMRDTIWPMSDDDPDIWLLKH